MPNDDDVYEFKSSPEDNAMLLNPTGNFGATAFEKSRHGLDQEADQDEGNLIGGLFLFAETGIFVKLKCRPTTLMFFVYNYERIYESSSCLVMQTGCSDCFLAIFSRR